MLKPNDKVKVKLHEPVGNATTETANQYLRTFEGRIGTVDKINKVGTHAWVTVWYPLEGSYKVNSGVFESWELEKVDEDHN